MDSLNKAWAPWLLDSLHIKNYNEIKSISKKYVLTFVCIVIFVLFLTPEVIYVLGGEQYRDAIYCLPPLIVSCVVQLIYTMYVNIEFYMKRTFSVSVATMIATAANIILNLIFIPLNKEWGFVIAAYTTLAGYLLLFFIHYFLVKKLNMSFVFDTKFLVAVIGVVLAVSGLTNVLYSFTIIRYIVIVLYAVIVVFVGYKNKDVLLGILKKNG